ncbi:MAG: transporter substrate-binding domain-containing protein [Lachnospiraceae bacterium]|jgi:cystine transport system substrate-binding protein|nr:transporter substrate-binding domain-containing protein [Lachnospiraceae bacterium]
MRRGIKFLTLATVLLLGAFCLSACGSQKEKSADGKKEEATELLEQIKERGTIIVATEGTWAPWTYHDKDDKLVGFDVEVAEKIAEKLGVKAEFVEVEWDGIFAGIDSGRYDITCNGVEIDEERARKYNFSDAYAYMKTALIVKDDNEEIKTFDDLKGKKTANTLQSTYAKLGEKYGAEVTGVDDLIQTIQLLTDGRVDATLNAEVSYYDYMKEHPDAGIKIAALYEEASEVAIPVRAGEENQSFVDAVNKAIKELSEEGVLTELSNKYFGSDITQK